ncbi:MAG: hypothetical protein AAFR33_13900 [Pseudomonadota bacterium]
MLRLIGWILILAGLAAAALGVLAWTAPQERTVTETPVATAPEREIALVLPDPTPAPRDMAPGFETNDFSTASMPNTATGLIPVAHEAPREARFGEPFEVTLSIDATGAERATSPLRGSGEIVEAQVELSGDIQARLIGGTAFEIDPQSPADQTLSRSVANVWRWNVMPLASGEHTLIIDVFMKTPTGTLQPVSSYSDRVTVQVSTLRQAITFAQTANPLFMVLGGIGSVLGGAVAALRFFSKASGRG